jgi:hypothetical protein
VTEETAVYTYRFVMGDMQIWRRHETDAVAMEAARQLAAAQQQPIQVHRVDGDENKGLVGVADPGAGASA